MKKLIIILSICFLISCADQRQHVGEQSNKNLGLNGLIIKQLDPELFLDGPDHGLTGTCLGPYQVGLINIPINAPQNPAPLGGMIASSYTLNLNQNGNAQFFSDASCSQAITSTILSNSDSYKNEFYVRNQIEQIVAIYAVLNGLNDLSINKEVEFLHCTYNQDTHPNLVAYNNLGNGEVGNRYELYTPEQIYSLASDVNAFTKHYLLCSDVDFTNFYSEDHRYFTIGGDNQGQSFTGSLIGLNHDFVGYKYDTGGAFAPTLPVYDVSQVLLRQTSDYIGLFSQIDTSKIVDVNLVDFDINVNGSEENVVGYYGLLAGSSRDSVLSGITVNGNIMSNAWRVGGVLGQSTGSDSFIENIHFLNGTIQGRSSVAGLIGNTSNHTIKNSSASVDIIVNSADGGNVGGLVGYLGGSQAMITESFSQGSVRCNGSCVNVGGLIGAMSDASIENSYSTANVVLVDGHSAGGLIGSVNRGTIKHAHATGNVEASDFAYYSGGLIGSVSGEVNISRSYAMGNVTGEFGVGGFAGLVGSYGRIQNIEWCYATGNVNAIKEAGGFAGTISRANIANAYASGSVACNDTICGGFIGKVFDLAGTFSTINNVYSIAQTVSSNGLSGGLIGDVYVQNNAKLKLNNSFTANNSITGSQTGTLIAAGTWYTTAQNNHYFSCVLCDNCNTNSAQEQVTLDHFYNQDNEPLDSWLFFINDNYWVLPEMGGFPVIPLAGADL
ncbi:MAG TPA: GLUG motif-containing protein [Oligoflexia bacterium]|nr:GLUG motif-containing protein [Oligoflexia bacterium]HMR25572.1 GLUG motif-containing protein [Oligoflexia bacterium]